jgi:glutaredoxin
MLDRVVTLYATAGCPRCDMARAFLERRSLHFGYVEVKEDGEAVRELIKLTGGTVVPTLVVGDDIQVGWDLDRFTEMLDDPLPLGQEELTIVLDEAEEEVARQEEAALREAQEVADGPADGERKAGR